MVMPARVADLLRARKAAQLREQLRAGKRWTGNPQGLVFSTRFGTPMPHNNVGESWRVRVKNAGLDHMKFHGGRHYAASYQFAMGARVEEVAAFLGHTDGSTVTRLYIHLTEKVAGDAAARTDLRFASRKAAAE